MSRATRTTFLRTRVGRRMVLLFVACALVPTTIMAAVVYAVARRQLTRQSDLRLRRDAKAYAVELMGRLAELRQAMERAAPPSGTTEEVPPSFQGLFRTTVVASRGPDERSGAGASASHVPTLTAAQQKRADRGEVVMAVTDARRPAVWLARGFARSGRHATLWAEADPEFIWSAWAQTTEPGSICVFEQGTRIELFCPVDASGSMSEQLTGAGVAASDSVTVSYVRDGVRYRAARWHLFLAFEYATKPWTIAVSERHEVSYADADLLRRTMALLVAFTVFFVLWLSSVQIRRSTRPLEALQEGTARVASGEYGSPVQIASGDEYEQLASSFNGMASAINRQVGVLTTMDAIDREALGPGNTARMVQAALAQYARLVPGAAVSIGVAPPGPVQMLQLTTGDGRDGPVRERQVRLETRDADELLEAPPPRRLHLGEGERRSWMERSVDSSGALVFPLVDRSELIGLVSLSAGATARSEEAVSDGRRIADRLAQAIGHVRLVQRLDDLSLGALTSFARAIDANSAWTAGHSERVTRLAVATGRCLGLADRKLEVLQRGGLLHDIGKIGVPPAILDKPGKLTAEEMALMQQHPTLGQRIVAPIAAFADALPIVRSHHERMDGGGYPDGLAGEDIPWLARVLAASDVYDALVSDRPYRAGWTRDAALSHLRAISGTHLDPRVVGAFLAAAIEGEVAKVYERSDDARDLAREVGAGRRLMGVRA